MTTRNDSERAERLKAALRDNLRRRKAQGRGRTEGRTDPEPAPKDTGPDAQS
ncbi:hypothetical protein [Methylobacterium durans]|jgi:hypothetical protein|uniref:hypothetical protein n=1 Tax=Methylobacterium durans TaxID=2202825 RepID=UPI00187EA7E1|nr:hypothetical protein [Methylobacterium durans]